MRDAEVCPESFVVQPGQSFDAARKDERLAAHLRQCRSCRREIAVAQAFKREYSDYVERLGMEDAGLRLAASVGVELARTSRAKLHARRGPTRMGWYLFAAAFVLVSIAAVAATRPAIRLLWSSSRLSPATPSAAVAPAVRAPAAEVASLPDETPDPEPALDRAAPQHPASSRAPTSAAVDSIPTARELFASANLARRDDNGARAGLLYRELQRRYPTSAEAIVSRVSFGRMLLDRLEDPAAALVQFDGYLAQTSHTALAEEALFGRASALARLGRTDAERDTWRTLLSRYPSSIYADRARIRIGAGP